MENTTPPTFTKTCSSCGLEKPLSAFLELSGDHAGTYGNVCGTCRKTSMDKMKPKDAEGSSRSGTGRKVDSKTKIASDIDKQESLQREEEEYHEERDENEIIETEETQKKDLRQVEQRKHRESFLDKRSYLTDKKKTDDASKTHAAQQEEVRDNQNVSDNTRTEQKKTEIDFTGPVLDTYIPGKEKFKGLSIRQFATWVGKGSAIGRTLNSTQAPTQANPQDKDQTLSEKIEQTWKPGSKR